MKQFILLALSLLLLQPATQVFAKDELPFHFSMMAAKQLTAAQLAAAEKTRTEGVVDAKNNTLKFSQNEVQLVVRTGPEDDMLSYRIQGLRNPTIVVPEMTSVKVLFVNVDEDMSHDFLLGAMKPPFQTRPDASKSAGSEHLLPEKNKTYNAQELSYHLHDKGTFHYFCSVGSHAKNGMWGTLVVGNQPIPAAKKMQHNDHHGMSMGMEGMSCMTDCMGCKDCNDCKNCKGCTDCKDCKNCQDCNDCKGGKEGKESKECAMCKK